VRCLALVRESLDGGFAASIALVFFFGAKNSKKGFSIAQYTSAGSTDASFQLPELMIEAS
jgi:hypothetical protein